jgi:hypothetical protein
VPALEIIGFVWMFCAVATISAILIGCVRDAWRDALADLDAATRIGAYTRAGHDVTYWQQLTDDPALIEDSEVALLESWLALPAATDGPGLEAA